MHKRKEMCCTCLFQKSIPAIPLEIPSLHSLPEAWASWEPRTFCHDCIKSWLHHPLPLVAAAEKTTVSCREAEGFATELSHTRFVTDNTVIVSKIWIAGFWLCSQVQHVTVANQETIVEIEHLASVGWKRGGQPFSCRCSQNVTHCRKEICWTCLFKESIPSIPFWNFKHPTYQKLEVPESRSTFRHLFIKWWHHAHPSVAAAEKDCVVQRSRGSGHGVVVPRIVTI